MYLNNRAAETLADGDVVRAYWWARRRFREAPAFPNSYNTLGVIYRHHATCARRACAALRAGAAARQRGALTICRRC